MSNVSAKKGSFSLTAYRGDAKTLLAFNLDKRGAKNLAGFTIRCQPKDQNPYFIQNNLRFQTPGDHAQDPKEPANSSINAPIHKFRWLHVPGSVHQGTKPFLGHTLHGDAEILRRQRLAAASRSSAERLRDHRPLMRYEKNGVQLGFTRGFVQSQAFVRHFGLKAPIRPKGNELLFDTSQEAGVNAAGERFTFQDEYEWLGFTAREKIFELLNEVVGNKYLRLDVFAYDLNEPDSSTSW